MELTKLLDKEHIFLDTRVQSDTDAIHRLGEVLKQSGYINDKYIDAVLAREVEFPTGLQLAQQGIAIPHATPEGMSPKTASPSVGWKNRFSSIAWKMLTTRFPFP